jgi:hypothetical protein
MVINSCNPRIPEAEAREDPDEELEVSLVYIVKPFVQKNKTIQTFRHNLCLPQEFQ